MFKLVWKFIKDKMEKIRKDDLDALGDMASLVGTYMNDFVSKTDNDARGKLFKTNIDPRKTLTNALISPTNDVAREIIPDNIRLAADGQALPAGTPTQKPQQTTENPVQNVPILNETDPNQMMFSFIDKPVAGYGNIGDVIVHFNKRLDTIEESINIIKKHLIDIKINLPKRRVKNTDESKEIT
jgi:hypothetical protein